jgi:hypothetical protein
VSMPGGIQQIKGARNQALWREVDERIKAVAETSGDVQCLCEWPKMDCTESVTMSVAEYERIRSSRIRFPIVVGHEFPELEGVIEVSDGYAVVQKRELRQKRPRGSIRAPAPRWRGPRK